MVLLLTGPTWPEFDFSGGPGIGLYIDGKRILLSEKEEIEQGHHTIRTAESVWDGSIVLAKFLEKQKNYLGLENAKVLELGAGRGIAGIAAGILGAECTITDLYPVIPCIDKSISLNRLPKVCALPLDWTEPVDLHTEFDYIIAADVIWVQELIEPLIDTIDELFQPKTIMYLCHQTRSTIADDILFDNLSKRRFAWEQVPLESLDYQYQRHNISIYKISRR
jgi:predicted nicotinamide N-methyase